MAAVRKSFYLCVDSGNLETLELEGGRKCCWYVSSCAHANVRKSAAKSDVFDTECLHKLACM